jgi:hypothetical protein
MVELHESTAIGCKASHMPSPSAIQKQRSPFSQSVSDAQLVTVNGKARSAKTLRGRGPRPESGAGETPASMETPASILGVAVLQAAAPTQAMAEASDANADARGARPLIRTLEVYDGRELLAASNPDAADRDLDPQWRPERLMAESSRDSIGLIRAARVPQHLGCSLPLPRAILRPW